MGAREEDSNATGIDHSADDDKGVNDNLDQGNNSASNSGAVYVFTRSGTTWSQQAYIKASNTGAGDFFGHSLSLSASGETLAVGANGEDSGATGIDHSADEGVNDNLDQNNNSAGDAGAVYVFTRDNDNKWSQQAYIKASNTGVSDSFGYSVSLDSGGNTLAVGAANEDSAATGIGGDQDNNSAGDSGAVYVFTRSGTTWSQQAYIKASNPSGKDPCSIVNDGPCNEFGDQFGFAVSLDEDGDTLAVGAYGEDSNATGIDGDQLNNDAFGSGAVYVFTRSHDTPIPTWSQQAYIKASNTGGIGENRYGDAFGDSVSLNSDGDTLAVGARWEGSKATGIDGDQGDNSAVESGAVYVFTRNGTTWSQQAYVKASNTDGVGAPLLLMRTRHYPRPLRPLRRLVWPISESRRCRRHPGGGRCQRRQQSHRSRR